MTITIAIKALLVKILLVLFHRGSDDGFMFREKRSGNRRCLSKSLCENTEGSTHIQIGTGKTRAESTVIHHVIGSRHVSNFVGILPMK